MYENYCCEEFAEHADKDEYENAAFVRDVQPGQYNINGCCGGGCFVVKDIRFCPFCGANLFEIEKI